MLLAGASLPGRSGAALRRRGSAWLARSMEMKRREAPFCGDWMRSRLSADESNCCRLQSTSGSVARRRFWTRRSPPPVRSSLREAVGGDYASCCVDAEDGLVEGIEGGAQAQNPGLHLGHLVMQGESSLEMGLERALTLHHQM